MQKPILDITLSETYNIYTIGFADVSEYDPHWNITNATFEVTAPGYNKLAVDFTPKQVNIYKSSQLGVTCGEDIDCVPLPDGMYTVKYSINPNSTYFIEKSFMRIANIQCQYGEVFLRIDFAGDCNSIEKQQNKKILQSVKLLIEGSVAAGNNCDFEQAYKNYSKAKQLLDNVSKCNCH